MISLILKHGLILGLLGASYAFSADKPYFTISDPRGDDFGAGAIRYPSSDSFGPGDLDLLEFSAAPGGKGVWFEVKFASRVREPGQRTSRVSNVPLSELIQYDFFNLNVDVYIDTDGKPGSGNVTTLPGREIEITSDTAWEKAVLLTPRPSEARSILRGYMTRVEQARREAESGSLKSGAEKAMKADVKKLLDEQFHFARRISVNGRTIRFFAPYDFLGGEPKPHWKYLVLVTGCDPEQEMKLSFLKKKSPGLMMMPLGGGRPFESFQVETDSDLDQPPIIDALLPTIEMQQKLLADYDAVSGRFAVLPAISMQTEANMQQSVVAAAVAPKASVAARDVPQLKVKPGQPKPPQKAKPAPAAPPVRVVAKPSTDALLKGQKPLKKEGRSAAERLKELKSLLDQNLITQEEYEKLRTKILEDI